MATRLMANYDGGLNELQGARWDLRPGKSRIWKHMFRKAKLDNAVPVFILASRWDTSLDNQELILNVAAHDLLVQVQTHHPKLSST